ncbi:hypothetical protein [Stackebrandtia nassauensis]|nr:hypothetical protein [Stackebrandtia nassauensis]
MSDEHDVSMTDQDWQDFWVNIGATWRRVLCGDDRDTPPPKEPILRRRRLTTDHAWVDFFPIQWMPAVREALLWQDNGMDLGPLTGRSWDVLQLGGPGMVDAKDLAGTPIKRLILSNVDVLDKECLNQIVGLESLTLAYCDLGTLPFVEQLTTLTVYTQSSVDIPAAYEGRLHVEFIDDHYEPPFGPDEVY